LNSLGNKNERINMLKLTLQSIRQTIFWTIVAGIIYPLVITVIAQVAFKHQAEGSLVERDGKVVGSAWLAQQFQGTNYFWPRPSAGSYGTVPSGASNLGPTSGALQTNVMNNVAAMQTAHGLSTNAPVPADLVYTSGSGLDPHISPEAARFQIARVATSRGLKEEDVKALVEQFVEPPQWGFLGQARVNVLMLNLALDKMAVKKAALSTPRNG
jgi:potassium-transporting ATPase KdpC subunit